MVALRDQPYIPLYVQDFLTDEKLNECSAESTGVYIKIMCIMHKSEPYGNILLKQKDKQNSSNISNFASKLLRHLPYSLLVIERSLEELIREDVLQIDGDYLSQKRMVRDCELSTKRAKAGQKGGQKTQRFASNFAQAKVKANPENENEIVHVVENENKFPKNFVSDIISYLNDKIGSSFKSSTTNTVRHIRARFNEGYRLEAFKKVIDIKYEEWHNNPKMLKYLRPETLFGTKFEGYLNQKPEIKGDSEPFFMPGGYVPPIADVPPENMPDKI
jgi:uncharacterized phage protein (TIGR02220 family)